MPDLSEFVSFIAERSRIRNLDLIEKDVMLHRILGEVHASELGKNYLFKGGSCLVKCYFGYYRFSVDLDFTWEDQTTWKGLAKKRLRRELLGEIENFGSLLERISKQINLQFENKLEDRRFMEFGGGGRMATFKLWKGSELFKIQVDFVEHILFQPKIVLAKTLLNRVRLTKDEKAYFEEFLEFYRPIRIKAYDERELLCEKIRAILTRRAQKLRDFYDLFVLYKHGFKPEDLMNGIVKKIKAALHYKKYRDALERNKEALKIDRKIMEDPFERALLVSRPTKEFEVFSRRLIGILREIAVKI